MSPTFCYFLSCGAAELRRLRVCSDDRRGDVGMLPGRRRVRHGGRLLRGMKLLYTEYAKVHPGVTDRRLPGQDVPSS